MKFVNIKIASFLLLAISFYSPVFGQKNASFTLSKEVRGTCENYANPYIEIGRNYMFYLTSLDSLNRSSIKKVKYKSKEIDFTVVENNPAKVSATPMKTGKASITTKVTLEDGTKQKQQFSWSVMELPELQVEITVTSPDSKFMWLNLIEKSTGQSANSSFNLCSIDFVLSDSAGNLKESGKSEKGDEYFPSVTLRKLPVQFQLNDRLKLEIIVTHYESNLPVVISQELTITSLWH
ncbi:MAG: hypothetical protein IPO32_11485 [Crocinitomicaceae bacterium]|nr:hypothetical protein [Crocinitomicaceae bacterium]